MFGMEHYILLQWLALLAMTIASGIQPPDISVAAPSAGRTFMGPPNPRLPPPRPIVNPAPNFGGSPFSTSQQQRQPNDPRTQTPHFLDNLNEGLFHLRRSFPASYLVHIDLHTADKTPSLNAADFTSIKIYSMAGESGTYGITSGIVWGEWPTAPTQLTENHSDMKPFALANIHKDLATAIYLIGLKGFREPIVKVAIYAPTVDLGKEVEEPVYLFDRGEGLPYVVCGAVSGTVVVAIVAPQVQNIHDQLKG